MSWPLQILALLALPVIPATATAWWHPHSPWRHEPARQGERLITLAEARASDSVLWIDARDEAAYEAEHIPGALSLNENK